MKGQPHLALSENPLKQGRDLEGLCGKLVEKPQWVFEDMIVGELRTLGQMTIKMCPKCTRAYFAIDPEEFKKYRYLYGMLPAVEVKAQDWEEAS